MNPMLIVPPLAPRVMPRLAESVAVPAAALAAVPAVTNSVLPLSVRVAGAPRLASLSILTVPWLIVVPPL